MAAILAADRAIQVQPKNPKAYSLKATALNPKITFPEDVGRLPK